MKKMLSVLCVVLSRLTILAGCQTEQPNTEPDALSLLAERVEELHALGLAIFRALVERMNGTIEARYAEGRLSILIEFND